MMNDAQILDRFDAAMARLLDSETRRTVDMLEKHGATETEIEAALSSWRCQWHAQHEANRAALCRMLAEPNALTGTLQ